MIKENKENKENKRMKQNVLKINLALKLLHIQFLILKYLVL
jgi:hypothetical protein